MTNDDAVTSQHENLNEEWPQKGTKEKPSNLVIFEPFEPFCGQMPSSSNEDSTEFSGQNDE
jgi:hypothetical protein